MSDLFDAGKLNVTPRVAEPRLTFHSYYSYKTGQIEVSVGRSDMKQEMVVHVHDPERGDTQILLSAQELAQEGLRIHRERFREETPDSGGAGTHRSASGKTSGTHGSANRKGADHGRK